MTSTAQCVKPPEQKQGTWNQIFPTDTTNTTQSTLFVKKLVAVAVSNVTYLRAIFPENAFGDRSLDDLNLKILRDDSSCPGACQVIKWVKGCFDAIDKKFLKVMIVGLYLDPKDPNTAIESYTFKFSYNEDSGVDIYRNKKKVSSAKSMDEIKKATVRLLRTIVVLTQTLSSLPDKVFMTMKLLYYEDITPTDYEPPGFHAASKGSFTFETEPMNIKVGDVFTPFHTVKMRIKTDASQFQIEEDPMKGEDEMTDTGNQETQDMEVDEEELERRKQAEDDVFLERMSQKIAHKKQKELSQSQSQYKPENSQTFSQTIVGNHCIQEPNVADSVHGNTPYKPGVDFGEAEALPSQLSSQTDQEDQGVNCPCGVNEDDGLMILCCICNSWQHAFCFKVRDELEAPGRHICNICGDVNEPDRIPTDPYLSGISEVAAQATCLYRRTLLACEEANKLFAPNLAKRLGVEMSVAQGLMSKLESESIIKSSGRSKRLGKTIDKGRLAKCIQCYFGPSKTIRTPGGQEARQNKPESRSEHPGKTQRITDNEMDKLVNRTGTLDVSGQWKPKIKGNQNDTEGEKRGKKRAKSMSSDDFELSNSQDESDTRNKKHKTSEVKRAVRV